MDTRLTETLGIELPIMEGGMQWVGTADLTAAVSSTGCLGTLTARTHSSYEHLCEEIERTRILTDRPFAVNISISRSNSIDDYSPWINAILDTGVTIVETAGNNPKAIVDALKPSEVKIVHKCTSLRHALAAENLGVDVVSIDGFEAAGHPGEDDTPLFVIVPVVARNVRIPIIASGGIATGRGIAAALALGADGVNIGTRFLLTEESPIHQRVKDHLLTLSELDTDLIARSLRHTGRYSRNEITGRVREIEETTPNMTYSDIADLISGRRGQEALVAGHINSGLICASQALGMINDIPDCASLVSRMLEEYQAASLLPQLKVTR